MEILRCSKCGSGQIYFRRKDNSSVCKTYGQVQVVKNQKSYFEKTSIQQRIKDKTIGSGEYLP